MVFFEDGQLDVPEALSPDQIVEDGGAFEVQPTLKALLAGLRHRDVRRAPQHVLEHRFDLKNNQQTF